MSSQQPMGKAAYGAMAATPTMEAVGLDWAGVYDFAEKSIRLIQDHGDTFLSMIAAGFRAFRAITGRDFIGIFTAINEFSTDLQKIIQAIRDEFGIE